MEVTEKLVALVEMFQADVGRVDFRQVWRGCTRLAGGTAHGPPLSKLQKLLATLRHRLAHLQQQEVRGWGRGWGQGGVWVGGGVLQGYMVQDVSAPLLQAHCSTVRTQRARRTPAPL